MPSGKNETGKPSRRTTIRSDAVGSLLEAQHLLTKQRWSDAEPILTEILGKIREESGLDDLRKRVGELLTQCRQGRAIEKDRNEGEVLLETFRVRRNEAMFHETHFTGLALPSDKEAVRLATRAALEVFARRGSENSWELGPLPGSLNGRDAQEIKESCYELLLILADVVEQPDLGLGLLDQAAALRPPTRVYHERRADQLARRGDTAGAKAERDKAAVLQPSSAIDYFLSGQEAYKRRDWKVALSRFGEALQIQPDHFWAHCLSAICDLQLSFPIQAKAELNACLQTEPRFAWLYELRGFASYQVAALRARRLISCRPGEACCARKSQVQFEAAEADFGTVLELLKMTPNDELQYALLVNRGLLWLERKEWDKAVADLERAIRLNGASGRLTKCWPRFTTGQANPKRQSCSSQRPSSCNPKWQRLLPAPGSRTPAHGSSRCQTEIMPSAILKRPSSSRLREVHFCPVTTPIRFVAAPARPGSTRRSRPVRRRSRSTPGTLDAPSPADRCAPKVEAAFRGHTLVRRPALARQTVSCVYELRALAKQELKDYDGAIEDNTMAHADAAAERDPPGTAGRALPDFGCAAALRCVTSRKRSISILRVHRVPKPTSAGGWPVRRWACTGKPRPTRRESCGWARRPTSGCTARRGSLRKPRVRRLPTSRRRARPLLLWFRATRIRRLSSCERQSRSCRRPSARDLCVTLFRPTRHWPFSAVAFGRWSWRDQLFHRKARKLKTDACPAMSCPRNMHRCEDRVRSTR